MAEREGRYRRGDDRDDDSLSGSSLSPSPPPVRRRRTPPREKPERDTGERLRDDEHRYAPSPRLPPEREGSRLTKPRDRDPRESRHPRDDRDRESPPPFQAKRQSITDRLRNSWQTRKDDMRGTPPPPPPNAAGNRPPSRMPSRRSSSAGQPPSKATPIGKVREWLDNCGALHGDHCVGSAPRPPSPAHSDDSADESALPPRRGGEPPTWRPIWLIDAVDRRLVRARETDRYMALSYVYERPPAGPSASGRNAPRETRRDNIGMLTDNLDDADMPQAISDGMWLARKLGIKLLWVDRFCIVQDDDSEREAYLRNMGHVFANAYLTVVAAAGDNAGTGLSALVSPGGKAPPHVPKEALGPPGRKGHEQMMRATRWTERCWTMVEGFYARRALFVFEETMTWECHCATWNLAGDLDGGPGSAGGSLGRLGGLQRVLSLRGSGDPGGRPQGGQRKCTARVQPGALGFRHPPWPDLDEYSRICMEYASRRLTHAEDTIDAFRGFTTILAKSFAGGFTFGMPALFLDAALLWRPAATIRRRALPPTMDSGGLNPLPSWSWMGWYYDGVAPDLRLWRAAADYVQEANSGQSNGKGGASSDVDGPRRRFRSAAGFRLRTICQFHVTDRATTAPVRNDGMRFRNARHQGRRAPPLPPGWSKSNSMGGFRHDSDPAALFKYPVPMATDIPPSELPVSGELIYPGTLLSFNTTRAMLQVDFAVPFPAAGARRGGGLGGPKPVDGDEGGIPLAIGNILAPRGKWIGTLRSHDAWLGLQGANYEGEERLEFIAISEGNERVVDGGGRQGGAGPVVSDVWGPGCDMDAVRAHADQDGILDFVNVLWVERVGGVCFRRGVGHIFVQAWEAFARERVEILLG